MAIFKSSDPQKLLAAAKATRESLISRRQAAEASAADLRERARQSARENADDAALSKIEASMRVQQDRITTLTAAVVDVEADITAHEREIAHAADQKMRSETVVQIETLIERWTIAETAFLEATQALEAIAVECGAITPDALGTSVFLKSAANELPPASDVIIQTLRSFASQVLSGTGRATMPRPAAPSPRLVLIEAPPMREVFFVRSGRYRGESGQQILLGQNRRHVLPVALAEKALRSGIAIPLTDARARSLDGISGMVQPDPARCESLDGSPVTEPKSSTAAPIMSSLFEPMDRGPAFNVRVPVEPIAAGQRSLTPDE